jgi:hypothetical protein
MTPNPKIAELAPVPANPINYTKLSEADLLLAALQRDERAWVELKRRYGKTVRDRFTWVALKFEDILDSDAADEMEQDFWVSLVENDMAKLRAFKPKRGRRKTFRRLGSWLSLLALRSGLHFVEQASHREMTGIIDKILIAAEGADDVEVE